RQAGFLVIRSVEDAEMLTDDIPVKALYRLYPDVPVTDVTGFVKNDDRVVLNLSNYPVEAFLVEDTVRAEFMPAPGIIVIVVRTLVGHVANKLGVPVDLSSAATNCSQRDIRAKGSAVFLQSPDVGRYTSVCRSSCKQGFRQFHIPILWWE